MLQSFLVYGIFAAVLAIFGNISAQKQKISYYNNVKNRFFTWDIIIPILIFSIISGIRWKVGTDHFNYYLKYLDLEKGIEFRERGIEKGFELLSTVFSNLQIHFTLYFSFLAFLQIFFFYLALKDKKYLLPFLVVILILGEQYLLWMNGIRQAIAACIFVYALQYKLNKKFWFYFIFILLASQFHKSAIWLIILYFIPIKYLFKNRFITLIIFIGSYYIGTQYQWFSVTQNIEKAIVFFRYDIFLGSIDYLLSDETDKIGIGPRRIIIQLLYLILIFYSNKLKSFFSKEETGFTLYYNLAIIGGIYFNLFSNTSHVFLRPVYYFIIFTPITFSFLLLYLKTKTPNGINIKFLIVLILSISHTLISIIADYGKGANDFTNFKFFWDYL